MGMREDLKLLGGSLRDGFLFWGGGGDDDMGCGVFNAY